MHATAPGWENSFPKKYPVGCFSMLLWRFRRKKLLDFQRKHCVLGLPGRKQEASKRSQGVFTDKPTFSHNPTAQNKDKTTQHMQKIWRHSSLFLNLTIFLSSRDNYHMVSCIVNHWLAEIRDMECQEYRLQTLQQNHELTAAVLTRTGLTQDWASPQSVVDGAFLWSPSPPWGTTGY